MLLSTNKKAALVRLAACLIFEIMNGAFKFVPEVLKNSMERAQGFLFSLDRSGDDLLFRALRRSTIGTAGFHFRVRDGTGWDTCVITTRSIKTKEGFV